MVETWFEGFQVLFLYFLRLFLSFLNFTCFYGSFILLGFNDKRFALLRNVHTRIIFLRGVGEERRQQLFSFS